MTELSRILTYIKEKIHPNGKIVLAPPLTFFFHADKSDLGNNLAILDTPISGENQDILEQLEARFNEYQRTPCLHYLDVFAPKLGDLFCESGYVEHEKLPIMTCTAESLSLPSGIPGIEIEILSSESTLDSIMDGWNANALGYDMNAELATHEQAEDFQSLLKRCRSLVARINGQLAGAGMFDEVRNGVTELSGIATLESYRRQGIASLLTAYATQEAFSFGADVAYLVPENIEAERVYSRIGYQHRTNMLVLGRKV